MPLDLNTKQSRGFVRAMARELLAHNSDINSVDDAIFISEELLMKTYSSTTDCQPTHPHGDTNGSSNSD